MFFQFQEDVIDIEECRAITLNFVNKYSHRMNHFVEVFELTQKMIVDNCRRRINCNETQIWVNIDEPLNAII